MRYTSNHYSHILHGNKITPILFLDINGKKIPVGIISFKKKAVHGRCNKHLELQIMI